MSNKLASAEGERWFARQAWAEPTPYTQEDLLIKVSAQQAWVASLKEGLSAVKACLWPLALFLLYRRITANGGMAL